jgi:F-type H+-transporting ATPase subunit delta
MAGRYATALFELARDENKLEETAAALDGLESLLAESEELNRLVRSPVFSSQEQSSVIDAIANAANIPQMTANFLRLLVKNRRLFALSDIIAGFRKLLAEHRNESIAEVISAIPLSNEQTEDLKATLRAKTGKDIILDARVDPALLGGLIVKIGSRMIDSSIRTKLNSLKIAMKEVG